MLRADDYDVEDDELPMPFVHKLHVTDQFEIKGSEFRPRSTWLQRLVKIVGIKIVAR